VCRRAALLRRLRLITPQGVVTARQKSAEGIVGEVHRGAAPDLLVSEGPNGPPR
jgi:hypothetical protein